MHKIRDRKAVRSSDTAPVAMGEAWGMVIGAEQQSRRAGKMHILNGKKKKDFLHSINCKLLRRIQGNPTNTCDLLKSYRIYSRNSRHRVIHAWGMVDQRVIFTSFLKTGISNALDGSEDDVLWQTEVNVDEESESEEDYSSEEESNDA